MTSRRAGLAWIASASCGTSRCGITLVYHDPGPKISQSASWTAVTASVQAGGSSGRIRTASTWPRVIATACWPRTDRTSPSPPRTSASISSGTRDIGSTRPETRSSAPAASSATTGSVCISISPHSTRLPTGCPASGSAPRKRYWNSRASASSPARAASACRRSPGGRTPRSARSRPLEPPSSATVTTAVIARPGTRRRARSDADNPCPPPNATTFIVGSFPAQVAVLGGGDQAQSLQPGGQLLGDGDAAVLAAGTADGHGQVPLALALEPRRGGADQPRIGLHEPGRARLVEHVPADLRLLAGVFA